MLGCTECGFDWERPSRQLAAEISQFGPLYRAQIEDLRRAGGDDAVRTRPAPEVWSPLEYMAHMRDVVDFSLGRIERILDEDRPQLTAVGFSALAEARRYNEEDVEAVLATLDKSASSAASRLGSLEQRQWNRVGIGTDGDERDVLVLARRLAHEGHHHLLDMIRSPSTAQLTEVMPDLAGEADIPSWLEIVREVEPLFGPMTAFDGTLERSIARRGAWCVRDNGGTVLAGMILSPPERSSIDWLAARTSARGHGHGRALVAHALREFASARQVIVDTFGEDNPEGRPARRLYESFGFVAAEELDRGPEGGTRQRFRLALSEWAH